MYFWKIENLKEDIKTKRLTEKDRFIYMFISLIITYSMLEIIISMPSKGANIWGVVYNLVDMLIIILGTFFAFRANGGAIGIGFLGKYFSISFVILLRFIPLFIFIIIITALIDYFFPVLNTKEINITLTLGTLSLLIWELAMYWRIIKHIKDVKEIQ